MNKESLWEFKNKMNNIFWYIDESMITLELQKNNISKFSKEASLRRDKYSKKINLMGLKEISKNKKHVFEMDSKILKELENTTHIICKGTSSRDFYNDID